MGLNVKLTAKKQAEKKCPTREVGWSTEDKGKTAFAAAVHPVKFIK